MASGAVHKPFSHEVINCTPSAGLSAGARGYFEVPVTYAKGKNIIATSLRLGHPGAGGGYQLTGSYVSTMNVVYISYYTPIALSAANADFEVDIVFSDLHNKSFTDYGHSETVSP